MYQKRLFLFLLICLVFSINILYAQQFIIVGDNTIKPSVIKMNFDGSDQTSYNLNIPNWNTCKGICINSNFSKVFLVSEYIDSTGSQYVILPPSLSLLGSTVQTLTQINGQDIRINDIISYNNTIYIVGDNTIKPSIIKMTFNKTLLTATTLNITDWETITSISIISNGTRLFLTSDDVGGTGKSQYIIIPTNLSLLGRNPHNLPDVGTSRLFIEDITYHNGWIYIAGHNNAHKPGIIKIHENGTSDKNTTLNITSWTNITSIGINSNGTELLLTSQYIDTIPGSQYISIPTNINILGLSPQTFSDGSDIRINDINRDIISPWVNFVSNNMPTYYNGSSGFTVTVKFSEDLKEGPAPDISILIDGTTASPSDVSGVRDGSKYNKFTFTFGSLTVASAVETSNIKIVVSGGKDLSGNEYDSSEHVVAGKNFDNIAPVFTVTLPVNNTIVTQNDVAYSLSQNLANGSITWTRTGGDDDDDSPHVYTLSGNETNTGLHNITNPAGISLSSVTVYSLNFYGQDRARNIAQAVVTNVTFDDEPPDVLSITHNVPRGRDDFYIQIEFDETVNTSIHPTIILDVDDDGLAGNDVDLTTADIIKKWISNNTYAISNIDLTTIPGINYNNANDTRYIVIKVEGAEDIAGNSSPIVSPHSFIADLFTIKPNLISPSSLFLVDVEDISFQYELTENVIKDSLTLKFYDANTHDLVLTFSNFNNKMNISNLFYNVNLNNITNHTITDIEANVNTPGDGEIYDILGDPLQPGIYYDVVLTCKDIITNSLVSVTNKDFRFFAGGPNIRITNDFEGTSNQYNLANKVYPANSAEEITVLWNSSDDPATFQLKFDLIIPNINTIALQNYQPANNHSLTFPFNTPDNYSEHSYVKVSASNIHTGQISEETSEEFFIGHHNIILCLDKSGSMGGTTGVGVSKIEALRNAADCFVNLIHGASYDNIGMVSFNHGIVDEINLDAVNDSGHKTTMSNTIQGLSAGGCTTIYGALKKSFEELNTPDTDAQRAVLLITDGKHNTAPNRTEATQYYNDNYSVNKSVKIFILGIGNNINESVLEDITRIGVENNNYNTNMKDFIWASGVPSSAEIQKYFQSWYGIVFPHISMLVDPIKTISQGDEISQDVEISRLNKQVTFLINWERSQSDLTLSLIPPSGDDNQIITPDKAVPLNSQNFGKPIIFHKGETYAFYRLNFPLKDEMAGQWEGEWRIKITGPTMPDGGEEEVAISVFATTPVSLDTSTTPPAIETGDDIVISTKISDIKSLNLKYKVYAEISIPKESIGNMLTKENIFPKAVDQFMKTMKEKSEPEPTQKSAAISLLYNKIKRDKLISYKKKRIRLYDDGRHSDRVKNDRIFANTVAKAKMPGVYIVKFIVKVYSKEQKTKREQIKTFFSILKISPKITKVKIEQWNPDVKPQKAGLKLVQSGIKIQRAGTKPINVKTKKAIQEFKIPKTYMGMKVNQKNKQVFIKVTITPMDQYKNKIGPFSSERLKFTYSRGIMVGNLIDNDDGSYSQILSIEKHELRKKLSIRYKTRKEFMTITRDITEPKFIIKWIWIIILVIIILIVVLLLKRLKKE